MYMLSVNKWSLRCFDPAEVNADEPVRLAACHEIGGTFQWAAPTRGGRRVDCLLAGGPGLALCLIRIVFDPALIVKHHGGTPIG